MKSIRILSLLSGIALLTASLFSSSVSFGKSYYGNDKIPPGQAKKEAKENDNSSNKHDREEMDDDRGTGSISSTGQSDSGKRRSYLSPRQRNQLENSLRKMPGNQRFNILIRALERISRLEINITNSSMLPARKALYLAQLEEIRMIIQQQINALSGSGAVVPDTTPPMLSSVTFSGSAGSGGVLSFSSSEAGTGYYLILSSGSSSPTSSQVKMGQNTFTGGISYSGSSPMVIGTNMLNIPMLSSSGSSYALYLAAEDRSGNLTVSPMSINIPTSPAPVVLDTTPPAISGYFVSTTYASGATFSVTLSESGTGFYVVLGSGSAAPNASQIKLGQDASGSGAAIKGSFATLSGSNTFSVTGLNPTSSYNAYFTAQDGTGNLQSGAQVASFTTTSQ